jgi:hypothetical protein
MGLRSCQPDRKGLADIDSGSCLRRPVSQLTSRPTHDHHSSIHHRLRRPGAEGGADVGSRPHPPHRTRRQGRAAACLLAVGALLLAACSDDDDALGTTTTSTTSSTTTSTSEPTTTTTSNNTGGPADDEEAEILDRYLAFWEARFEANTEPVNPDDERLAELATGAQLDNVRNETRQRAEAGLALRRPEDSITERRPRVVEINGDEATIQDCAINDGIIYRVATGEVIDDSVATRSVVATMRLFDGRWRLESAREIQKWQGVAGCALASDS